MTFYFMGGEVGAFTPQDGSSGDSHSVGSNDSSFCRGVVYAGNTPGTSIVSAPIALPDAWWFHADVTKSSSASLVPAAVWRVGTSEVLRLVLSDSTIRVQANIAATWTYVSGSFPVPMITGRQTVDVSVEGNDATGVVKVYVEGTLRDTSTGVDLSAVTGIDNFTIPGGNGSAVGLSQVILSDEPTVGTKLLTRYANGAGATTDFTGGYTGIDEIPYSDADFVNSATNGHIELFTNTGPAITGYTVRAVGVYARAKKGASGPANLQLALRSAAVNDFSASKALDVGYASYGHIWETDPATSAAWLSSAIDTLQFGVKAVT
jgi:hypothetical protein